MPSLPCGGDVEAYTRLYTPVTRKKDFFCNFCIFMIEDGHHSGRTDLIQYCYFIKLSHLMIYNLQCTMYNLTMRTLYRDICYYYFITLFLYSAYCA